MQRLNRQGSEPSTHRPQSRGGQRRTSSRWVSEGHAQTRLRLKQSDPRRRVKYHAPLSVRCQRHQSTQLTSRVVTWLKSPSQMGHSESLRISDHLSPSLSGPLKWSGVLSNAEIPVQILARVIFVSCALASAISASYFDKKIAKKSILASPGKQGKNRPKKGKMAQTSVFGPFCLFLDRLFPIFLVRPKSIFCDFFPISGPRNQHSPSTRTRKSELHDAYFSGMHAILAVSGLSSWDLATSRVRSLLATSSVRSLVCGDVNWG